MKFRNEYWFMSNMSTSKIVLNGLVYYNAESAFQSFKVESFEERLKISEMDGKQARSYGRKVKLRDDWNAIRVEVMFRIQRAKYRQNPHLFAQLKSTKGEIAEDNTWGDKFWGKVNGVGENHLGKILMYIRDKGLDHNNSYEPA